ncbi:MAG: tRNA (guanosine(37)-N1)-methyltransferase TrmD, partial [Gemmatimonadetes bacterium]|nr:tRNA (guanosine(37)-N1)-methyltransferase TrmD [Gemmatimonadota bacterium]
MRITVFSIFPELIEAGCRPSILGSAIEKGILEVRTVDPRTYTEDRHRTVDDEQFGGGAGMVMMPGPLSVALDRVAEEEPGGRPRTAFLTPAGRPLTQEFAEELAREPSLFLVCGRYKGIDERVLEEYATDEISIGDYVLS